MPAVARELSIVYGTYTIGGTTDRLIDGKFLLTKTYRSAAIEAEFVVTDTTEAGFKATCDAAEAAFRTPRQRIQILLGSSTLLDLDPSTNSGFNAAPSIRKVGNDLDTARSRKYAISVTVELPADLAGQDGRIESTIALQYDPNRKRTLTISGTYTALGGNSAFAQYSTSISSYQSSIQTAFGGTWELINENVSHDDTNKNASFSRVFREIIFNQGSGTLDDPEIVEQNISYSRTVDRPGDSPNSGPVNRLETIVMTASMFIDKTLTVDLRSKYQNSIRAYLIQLAFNTFSYSSGALMAETPSFDFHQNSIQVSMTFKMVGASNKLQYTRVVQITVEQGYTIVPVWEKIYSKHLFQGPANKVRTTTETEVVLSSGGIGGGGGGPQFFGAGGAQLQFNGVPASEIFQQINDGTFFQVPGQGAGGGGGGQGGFVVVRTAVTENPMRLGSADRFIDVINRTGLTEEIWIETPSQGNISITPVT